MPRKTTTTKKAPERSTTPTDTLCRRDMLAAMFLAASLIRGDDKQMAGDEQRFTKLSAGAIALADVMIAQLNTPKSPEAPEGDNK